MNTTKSLLSGDRTERKQTQQGAQQGDVLGPQGWGRPLGRGSQVRSRLEGREPAMGRNEEGQPMWSPEVET